jgi:hypothetical protein
MAMKAFTDDPKFQPFFKLKEYLDEVMGAIGMYKAPFIKTKEELEQTQIGEQLVEKLGELVASGGPEVQAKIKEFLDSLGVGGQVPEVGGQPPEIGSETQAEGGPAPAPIETAPAGMPPTA